VALELAHEERFFVAAVCGDGNKRQKGGGRGFRAARDMDQEGSFAALRMTDAGRESGGNLRKEPTEIARRFALLE
jgi:hypothetical protein